METEPGYCAGHMVRLRDDDRHSEANRPRDSRSVSISRLLTDIAVHSDVMTRRRHISASLRDAYDDEDWRRREGERSFDRHAGAGAQTMPPERVLADRKHLDEIAEPIIRHVNKRVAHFDERELAAVLTYAEINDALDFIGELLNKYESLLKAARWGTLVPVHQADWTQAFTVAWKRN